MGLPTVKVTYSDLDLHLLHTFRISRSATDVAQNLLVTLEHGGFVGLGEAYPPTYFGEDRERARRALDALSGHLDGPLPLGTWHSALGTLLGGLPAEVRLVRSALAALDMALHDLIGKMAGQPLWRLFGLGPQPTPVTSFTIAIASIEEMRAYVREAERYPLLKIKVGTDYDLEILEAIRSITDKALRVDANAAWSVEEAIAKIRAIEPYGIELIEQPIPPGDIDGLRRIRDAVSLPIIVDESVVTAADIPPLAGAVDGINVKLMKCGGLREARRMIDTARSLGLKVMLGCYVESSVGITAAAHLAPLADYVDLDGNLLIANDPYEGVGLDAEARLVLPDRPGLGVRPRGR